MTPLPSQGQLVSACVTERTNILYKVNAVLTLLVLYISLYQR